MMRVVFFDKMRETYRAVEDVLEIKSYAVKVNGRITNVWHLVKSGGEVEAFKQKDFTIHRVEI